MEAFLITMIVAATPLLLAATGELVAERSGVLNLGVEGMMLLGAVAAFAVALSTGSSTLGIVAGAGAGALAAALFALVALGFTANQAARGLALAIFGTGVSGLIGQGYVGRAIDPLPPVIPADALPDAPVARVLLGHDAMVYLALALALAVWFYLGRTRSGLKLRAIGDDAESAHAVGLSVLGSRTAAVMFGGACAGLAGAYLSLAYTPLWGENMTAGRGWIALALVVFAGWGPIRVIFGAYLFAAASLAQFYGGALGLSIPSQFLAMAPYLATILALVVISAAGARRAAPAMLGLPFRPDR
jgi:simple sugar transport system permease protein